MSEVKDKKTTLKGFLISMLTAMMFSIFLPVFIYTNNIAEASFIETFPIILLFAGIGAVIYGIVFLCFRKNVYLSTVASVLLILFLSNYALIEKGITSLFPRVGTASIFILLLCIMVLGVFAANKFVKDGAKEILPAALLIVISVLILLNVVFALPKGIHKLAVENSGEKPQITVPPAVSGEKMPNVYYLIFDEYSNSEMMKKYYDYDNTPFDRYLEEKGFSVSPDTKNGNIATVILLANYMNYDYVANSFTDPAERDYMRENNKLTELFLSKGYTITGVGGSSLVGVESVTEDARFGSLSEGGDSIATIILTNTVYKLFYDYRKLDAVDNINKAINYFTEENVKEKLGGNNLTMFYVCCPHPPYLFDQDGSMNEPVDYKDTEDKTFYLNQYIYMTKKMRQIVDTILAYDEDCVIILQSDHASRHSSWITDEDDQMKPFNAVYFRGEDISEIKGQSGVNTIRLVLNRLFDMNLEILEVNEK